MTSPNETTGLTIGALARAAGVHVETIRYYQRIGLLEEPPKPRHGYRRYPRSYVGRIRFVRRAQQAGFTLKEIGRLFLLGNECSEVRRLAEEKRRALRRQIAHLQEMEHLLSRLADRCEAQDPGARCALIDELTQTEDDAGPA